MHKRFDWIINQERRPGLTRREHERLSELYRQMKVDIASIWYGAWESEISALECCKIGR